MREIINKTLPVYVLLVFLGLFGMRTAEGAICVAEANGLWGSASTWSCGRVPQSGDEVIIIPGVTIEVKADFGTYSNMVIHIYGTLVFEAQNSTITMNATSVVAVYGTGRVTSPLNNNSAKLTIGTLAVYVSKGDDLLAGCFCNTGACNVSPCYDPLPVTLAYFRVASTSAQEVRLEWATLTEKNNKFFAIERSADGQTFTELLQISGKGNSEQLARYQASDFYPLEGRNYYRLRQTDTDGSYSYSPMVQAHVATDPAAPSLRLFPNPAGASVQVSWNGGSPYTQARVLFYNSMGQVVHTHTGFALSEKLPIPDHLPGGFYRLVFYMDEGTVLQSPLVIGAGTE